MTETASIITSWQNTKQVQKDWNSAEDLMAQAPQYNYGLVLDYNSECTPGKGIGDLPALPEELE